MTLLTTEIHRSADGDIVVFAADRRISRGQLPAGNRQKVFRVPRCRAGVGYFGLAEVGRTGAPQPMAEWLQDLFYEVPADSSTAEVARIVCERLNVVVPQPWRDAEHSGFHVAGVGSDGRAEFWFVRNFNDDGSLMHGPFQRREDFQSRDAPRLPQHAAQIYRNGDIRAHVAAWESIDKSFGALLGQESFRALRNTDDYVDWVKYKMELVAHFYERFATESIIGVPIDAFAISKDA